MGLAQWVTVDALLGVRWSLTMSRLQGIYLASMSALVMMRHSGAMLYVRCRFTLVILSARPAWDLQMLRGGQEQNRQSV
jgi:hypothetical protein